MTYLIEAQQLNKTYGKHQVIQDLNLQIKQGSLVAYLGTNGAQSDGLSYHLEYAAIVFR